MKKMLLAAAVAIAGAGFVVPSQASAAVVSPAASGSAMSAGSAVTDVQYYVHRRGHRPRGYVRWHRHHLAHRHWHHRPHYGRIVGGIALGTLLAGSAYYAYAGAPPAPGLCWYWADPYERQGYWDYC
jgi:hypothetical protein